MLHQPQPLLRSMQCVWQAASRQQLFATSGAVAAMMSTSPVEASSTKTSSRTRWGYLATALAGLGLTGTAVAKSTDSTQQPEQQAQSDPYQIPKDVQGLPKSFTLYQYEVCPFCCKVKAMLDYHKLPYHVVEVNPLTKGELKWSKYKKVPILKWDDDSGHVENDSTRIMSRLAAELKPTSTSTSTTTSSTSAPASVSKSGWGWGSKQQQQPQQQPQQQQAAATADKQQEEERWRRWVDERFVKVITANIYRNWNESVDTFKYITTQTNWSWGTREAARWAGATLMWQVGKGLPAKYKIEGDLRAALYSDCDAWVDAVGSRPFLGGDAPSLADLAVYGVLKAIWHTPTFQDAMNNSKIKPWYIRMEAAIGQPSVIQD